MLQVKLFLQPVLHKSLQLLQELDEGYEFISQLDMHAPLFRHIEQPLQSTELNSIESAGGFR